MTMACRWSGRYVWGVSYNGLNIHSASCPLPEATPEHPLISRSVVVSTSEAAEILQRLTAKFTVIYAAGAGYKILCVCDQLVSSYVVSHANTFKWDTCAPHAILLAQGGGIVDLQQVIDTAANHTESASHLAAKCQLCYNRANDGFSAGSVDRWSNHGGIIAYHDIGVLADVVASITSCTT